jgi:magnesium chelatase subunit H
VDLPESVDSLRDCLLVGNAAQFGTQANAVHQIPVAQHIQQETWLAEIEAQWGAAPGKHLTDGRSLFVMGAQWVTS